MAMTTEGMWAERAEAVARMTRQGMSAREIAVRLGVTQRSVQRDRARMGLTTPPTRVSEEQYQRAYELLCEGSGYKEAAATVGCTPAALRERYPGMAMEKSMVDYLRRVAVREHYQRRRTSV
ncbi:DNA binding protein [Gordonia phage Sour]|uniref:Helix-turn-helix DNA binding protein n=1 Tax=Gordonia phage Sour TaxID=2182349 RepID=A0A2U8UKM2_9CAUD|nr:DNA binding protein [Gordonia phage Sour]AWN04252.1 helix-turn-helix DNA binding protein [Gordonia phage Sour]